MSNLGPVYRFAAATDGPHLLLTAGVHGDEYEPVLALRALLADLPSVLTRGRVTVVPVVNPGAFRAGSRCAPDGLDLARTCPGRPEGTPTERVAAEVSALIREADAYIDLHTGGVQLDLFPLTGYLLHPDEAILNEQRQLAQAFGLPLIWGTEPTPEGRTISVARDAGIPALYAEYGGNTGIRLGIVTRYRAGIVNVLRHLGMAGGAVEPPAQKPYWLEDHTPGGGFLQGKMPSPFDGMFLAAVQPGEFVRAGQPWGRVLDPLGGREVTVETPCDGLAFLRRNLVHVAAGDALGGVLPVGEPGNLVIHGKNG